ncbi:MAG TPA: mycofactocin radical SAM maturase [Chloroflexaceae bacterium]|nr:mycofactocin radical SAM maturase [Chloroflexaceae bacterium]
MDLSRPHRLAPQAAIRPERFGGLVYRYDNRRLYFLHSQALAELVGGLDGAAPLGATLDGFMAARGLPAQARPAYERTLAALGRLGVVEEAGAARPEARKGYLEPPAPGAGPGPARGQSYELFRQGLDAPICLTWELTYGCNLRCVHCLSSSGHARADELSTAEAKALIDEWAAMQVFYINVGGGEPMSRPDFFELMDYCLERGIGVKFSTNGTLIDAAAADWIASSDYLDVQISLDGADAATNDPVRGTGSFRRARRAMELLAERGFCFKINTVLTRQNAGQLDRLYALATGYGAQLRVTRLRPSGRGQEVWEAMRPTMAQNRAIYDWLQAHADVMTGDSFFHLSAFGAPLDGLNMCGAGRIVCCVDPVGEVYACPFVLSPEFSGGNVRRPGGFTGIWRESALFAHLRAWQVGGSCASCNAYASCHGGCMAAKHFTGLALDDPDPDCVFGNAVPLLAARGKGPVIPLVTR